MPDPVPPQIAIVVPCYNEAARLDGDAFLQFARQTPGLCFLLVNDGSRDATLSRLHGLAQAAPGRFEVIDQQPNAGKAAAVRRGMLRAFDLGVEMAGYWDADLATPLAEIPRFVEVLRDMPERLVVFGARVQLLGRSIQRKHSRHMLGRVFATAASSLLEMPIYDTQCGAKLFRVNATTRALFAEPFAVGWTFDVEIVARLAQLQRRSGGPHADQLIYELPLLTWHDVAGSKVSAFDFVRAAFDLNRVRRRYLR
jgi:glycosyltransferase involved in cell wall biosynthesis